MKKFAISLAAFLVLSTLLTTGVLAATVTVTMSGMNFVPQTVTVNVGDTVVWSNTDSMVHTATSGSNCASDGLWNSGNMNPGTTYSYTFTQAGTYPYYCIPHCSMGMTGTVVVNPASNSNSVDFSGSPTSGTAPLSVTFTPSVTGTASSYSWDFGDGATSTQSIPTHTYTGSGAYTVTLTVTFSDGSIQSKARSDYIVLSTSGPAASVWHDFFAVDLNETPMTGDFNGDGKVDIITFTRNNPNAVGDVYVALSDGTRFGSSSKWNDWFAIDQDQVVVIGDFDGDRIDDIATWLKASTRQVYVAKSHGAGMHDSFVWLGGIGSGSNDVLKAADVDGDGKEDLVLFARDQGNVYVALSNGSGFNTPQVWHNFFAVSSYERPEVGDVNGDGMADILTFATNSPTSYGDVYVAVSDGRQFGNKNSSDKWNDFFAVEPTQKIQIGDLNGDGMDDFFTFMPTPNSGQVYVVYSRGTFMSENYLWTGSFAAGLSADVPFADDVNGDGKADLISFRQSEGRVYVAVTP